MMGAPTKVADLTVVNGINVDDLIALIDDVKREPEKGKTNWHAVTTWQGQARSRAEIESYELGGEKVPRGSRSTSTSPVNSADRTSSPIRRSI